MLSEYELEISSSIGAIIGAVGVTGAGGIIFTAIMKSKKKKGEKANIAGIGGNESEKQNDSMVNGIVYDIRYNTHRSICNRYECIIGRNADSRSKETCSA